MSLPPGTAPPGTAPPQAAPPQAAPPQAAPLPTPPQAAPLPPQATPLPPQAAPLPPQATPMRLLSPRGALWGTPPPQTAPLPSQTAQVATRPPLPPLPRGYATSADAAAAGDLSGAVQTARREGRWDPDTIPRAIKNGHGLLCPAFVLNGCRWPDQAFEVAASVGDAEFVFTMPGEGFPCPGNVLDTAATHGQWGLAEQLHQAGYTATVITLRAAAKSGSLERLMMALDWAPGALEKNSAGIIQLAGSGGSVDMLSHLLRMLPVVPSGVLRQAALAAAQAGHADFMMMAAGTAAKSADYEALARVAAANGHAEAMLRAREHIQPERRRKHDVTLCSTAARHGHVRAVLAIIAEGTWDGDDLPYQASQSGNVNMNLVARIIHNTPRSERAKAARIML